MNKSNFTKAEAIRAKVEAMKRAKSAENEKAIEEARKAAQETVQQAQRQANVLIGNATFQYIYYIHNNIIHRIDRKGNVLPYIKNAFGHGDVSQKQLEEYKKAMGSYNAAMEQYEPYKLVDNKRHIDGKVYDIPKYVENPEPAPIQPDPPRPSSKDFNSAVSDIIVDKTNNVLYWGRWADPYKIVSMKIDTSEEITELFIGKIEDMVTSVALDLSDPDNLYLYWIEGHKYIKRGKIDATGQAIGDPEIFLTVSASDKGGLWQLEIDTIHKRLYWTNDISIWRADIPTDFPTTHPNPLMVIAPFESPFPIDLAVDGRNGFLYWIDNDMKKVRKSDLEGVHVEDLYDLQKPTRGLKVDAVANLLYWSDDENGKHVLKRGSTQNPTIQLDGFDDYVEITHFRPTEVEAFTIEMWVNIRDADKEQTFLFKRSNQQSGGGHYEEIVWMGINDGKLHVELRGKQSDGNSKITEGLHHIAMTVSPKSGSSSFVNVYLNGVKVIDKETISEIPGAMQGSSWFFGKDINDSEVGEHYFKGGFNELRIWGVERKEEEIQNYRYQKLLGNEADLVGYWRADELQGDILPDLSKNGRFGTVVREGVTLPTIQPVLQFDGNTNYVELPNHSFLFEDGLCLEAWIFFDDHIASPQDKTIFYSGTEAEKDFFNFLCSKNSLEFKMRRQTMAGDVETPEDVSIKVEKAFKTDQWNHVAVTLSPDFERKETGSGDSVQVDLTANFKATLYINGHLEKEESVAFLPKNLKRTVNLIGHAPFDNQGTFDGKMSELRLWNHTKNQSAIMNDLHSRINSQSKGLVGYWPLNEGEGIIIDDMSIHDLNGTLKGKLEAERKELTDKKHELHILQYEKGEIEKRLTAFKAQKEKIDDVKRGMKTLEDEYNAKISERSGLKVERDKIIKEEEDLTKTKIHFRQLIEQYEIILQHTPRSIRKSMGIMFWKKYYWEANPHWYSVRANLDGFLGQEKQKNAEIKEKEAEIKTKQTAINKLNRTIEQLKLKLETPKKQIHELELAIYGQTETQFQEEIDAKTEKIRADKLSLVDLKAKLANGGGTTWSNEPAPVNTKLEKRFEVETLKKVPGLDGMSLVSVEEFQRAKRKKVFDELLKVKIQKENERALAIAAAEKKHREADNLKKQKEQEASDVKTKGLAKAANKKERARLKQEHAIADAENEKHEAELAKRRVTAEASKQAAQTRQTALDMKKRIIGSAENKKKAAQAKVNDAKKEKRRRGVS